MECAAEAKQTSGSLITYAINQTTGEPTLIQSEDVRGIYPRTFALDPVARMLAVTNMEPKLVRDGGGLRAGWTAPIDQAAQSHPAAVVALHALVWVRIRRQDIG